jgi:hypothetical protein
MMFFDTSSSSHIARTTEAPLDTNQCAVVMVIVAPCLVPRFMPDVAPSTSQVREEY